MGRKHSRFEQAWHERRGRGPETETPPQSTSGQESQDSQPSAVPAAQVSPGKPAKAQKPVIATTPQPTPAKPAASVESQSGGGIVEAKPTAAAPDKKAQ